MSADVGFVDRLKFIAANLQLRELRLRSGQCPICGRTLFVRLQRDLLGTRCVRCGATPIAMAIVRVIRERVPHLADCRVYEASSRGPVFAYLQRSAQALTGSEYIEGVPLGTVRDGVRCEDLEALTFPDDCFDLCTSTEVFEHVADDVRGFAELHRVLRWGGQLIFTVPLADSPDTVERAVRDASGVRHLLPATYHGDRIRGHDGVLVFRDYGRDIVERLRAVGFGHVEIVEPVEPMVSGGMGHRAPVIVATKRRATC